MKAVIMAALLAAAPPATTDPGLDRGREASRLLFSGDPEQLAPMMTPEMLAFMGGPEGLNRFAREVREKAGAEAALLREAVFLEDGFSHYYRESRLEKVPRATLQWVFEGGRISGAWIGPSPAPAPNPNAGYVTRAPLRLPFAAPAAGGAWQVMWGGRNAIDNYHVIAADQSYAYDFALEREGRLRTPGGTHNEAFYCWNEPVLAPAAGRIVSAVGDVPDNPAPPAIPKGAPAPGNHVVIDHGQGEYSLVAHFRAGSLAVRPGDRVKAGTLLGRCGNSGNSTMPHVHYHLSTKPGVHEGLGLPAFFNGYEADGGIVERGEPKRGQRVLPAVDRPAAASAEAVRTR
jgi:murein DD-endopeptidase MepM/ murein hydrolase activator NlpD